MTDKRAELYLILEAGPDAADRLGPLLAQLRPASVLLTAPTGGALDVQALLPLVRSIQSTGAAALVGEDARVARTVKADGVHLAWSMDIEARYREARDIVGTRAIVGAEAGTSRHDAMTLGEAGADYVAFRAEGAGGETAETRDEMTAWWGEIFEVPGVAFDVDSAEDCDALVALGADFVSVRVASGTTIADELERIGSIAAVTWAGAHARATAP